MQFLKTSLRNMTKVDIQRHNRIQVLELFYGVKKWSNNI